MTTNGKPSSGKHSVVEAQPSLKIKLVYHPDRSSTQQSQSSNVTKQPKVDPDAVDTDIELFQGTRNQDGQSPLTSLRFVHYEHPKRKQHTDTPDEARDQSVPPAKKACRRDVASRSKAKNDTGVRTFTVYLRVWSTQTITEPNRWGKAAKTTIVKTSDSMGPFRFDTSRDFDAFQREVARALSCPEDLLPVSEFGWKFEGEPQRTPHKNITNAAGFDALVEAVKKTRVTSNVVVWLHLPKPGKVEEDCDTDRLDYVEQPSDEEHEDSATMEERVAERDDRRRALFFAALETLYPVGNVQIFQDKRVWENPETGNYIELTPIRMKAWVDAIISGTTDICAPPKSAHFSEDNELKIPSAVDAAPGVQPVVNAYGPPSYPTPYYAGYPQPPLHYTYYPPYHMPYMPPPPGYMYPYAPPYSGPRW